MIANEAHLHLILNHFPILGVLFAIPLLAYGVWKKDTSVERAGLLFLIFVGFISIFVYLSGEAAEDIVENMQGVSEIYLEKHEEIASLATLSALITGFLALLTFLASLKGIALTRMLSIATLLFTLVTSGIMGLTGNYGGKIRHSEIRGDIPSEPHLEQENKGEYED